MKKTMSVKIIASIFVFFLSHSIAMSQNWQIVNPKYQTNDAIVAGFVADAATYGNGTTDATSYIQNCLNQLDNYTGDANHGGGVLFLPEGKYKITGTILIPKGITLRGDWKKPVKGQAIQGTVLMAYSGRGNESGTPFIMMEPAAAVMDLAIWYPEQSADNITPYPPAIQFGKPNYFGNEFCNAKNITLVNAYSGIYFHHSGGTCPTINGVYGTPLKQGIEIDRIVDIGRIEWVDFSPAYWAGSGLSGSPSLSNTAYTQWLYNNGTGVVMRRNDWSYTCYLTVEGYNKGFYATRTLDPNDNATPNGHNYGFNFKNCKYGLYFDGTNTVGCMFTEVKVDGCEYGAYLSPSTAGVLQLYKWDIRATNRAIYGEKTSTTKTTLQQSTINGGKVLLQGGTLIAMDNDFNNVAPQVEFEANSRGHLTGNRFSNPVQIRENSIFVNKIDHTPVTVEDLPAYYEFIPQAKKPARNVMYNVLSSPYNAQKGTRNNIPSTDATSAIQTALNKAKADGGGVVYLPPGHYRINGSLVIPQGVELKGGIDIGAFPMGPGTVLEIYGNKGNEAGTSPIQMQQGSGLRGIVFNYPEQVLSQVLPESVNKYPYTIQMQGNDAYIVNVGLRAALKGVDIFTYRCDRFYIDFLTGHVFDVGVKVGNGSKDGIISNMQFNTIVYNCGDESKFGGWPNSDKNLYPNDATKNPYDYNAKYLDFLIVGNAPNIILYNDFNYCANNGIILENGAQGLAIGLGLDGDRTGILVDGNANFDFINTQDVALNFDALGDKSSYIKTTNKFASGSIKLFSSDYWGQATSSAIIMNGSGSVNLQSANFESPGSQSFGNVNAGRLDIGCSVINPKNPLFNGSSFSNIYVQGSLLDPYTLNTASLGLWHHNMGFSYEPSASSALDRTGWIATASRSFDNSRNPSYGIDGNATSSWSCGWQNDGTEQWYQVDMLSPKVFNEVILEYAGSPNDGPDNYILSVSNNGSSWTEVAQGTGANQMTVISFSEVTARYIRITKPASVTRTNFWAIHELYVFNVSESQNIELTPFYGTPLAVPGIVEAEDFDLGGEGIAYHDTTDENQGGQYRTSEGVDIENCSAGGYNIGFTMGGEWIKYTINVATTGLYNITSMVSSPNGGSFSLSIDDEDVSGQMNVNSGDWQIWDAVTVNSVLLEAGTHVLTFHTTGNMNVDKFIFAQSYGGTPYAGTPYPIPGVIEAEDFDNGGEGVAYHDQEAGHQNAGQAILYRPNEGVEVESYASGEYNIGFTINGEWTKYTFYAEESGYYDIDAVAASGATNGKYHLEIDGENVSGIVSVPNTGGWNIWQPVTSTGIYIAQGIHVLTWYTYGAMNLDKFVFRNSSDLRVTTGVDDIASQKVLVYPNPTNGIFNINTGQPCEYRIVDLRGVTILSGELTNSVNTMDISNYSSGIYFVITKTGNDVQRVKLIKK